MEIFVIYALLVWLLQHAITGATEVSAGVVVLVGVRRSLGAVTAAQL